MDSDGIQGLQSITDVTNEEKPGDAVRHRAGPGEHSSLTNSPGLSNVCITKGSHIPLTGVC